MTVYVADKAAVILPYYFECTGTNPLNVKFENISTALFAVNEVLITAGFLLPSACNLISPVLVFNLLPLICFIIVVAQLSNLLSTFADIVTLSNCTQTSNIYNSAVNQSICSNFYSGLFIICITHFVVICLTIPILVVVSAFHDMYLSTGGTRHIGEVSSPVLIELSDTTG